MQPYFRYAVLSVVAGCSTEDITSNSSRHKAEKTTHKIAALSEIYRSARKLRSALAGRD
jgi:hypothetical protein